MISHNFNQVEEPDGFNAIRKWIRVVAKELFPSHAEICYVYCSDDDLLALNNDVLQHDYYTDILTFDLRDKASDPLSCEIYISIDRVAENATSFNCTFAQELKRVMVHGLLHLSGMNDSTENEKLAMRAAENKYINSM